ncbi:heat shock factor protein-like isoform X2 [Stegodyphus dumicola]|uniref:heat shock factor protein-like isoform X2 n=1 Tax=Stegodyphus dumicola TaxID=202533 RepID=UPI0015B21271|nr:heat shock factor protein-like isoform X2 [Stegodyphus dumicola]
MSFIIRDQARFAKELLPQYFKHNNMASFIRQLNMYGFRKVMNYEKSGLRNENDEMEFQHSFFMKDQEHLLELIKRKIPNTKIAEPIVKANTKDILTDLTSIREKQENMDNMLIKMKQENELLWRELTSMRQKHKAQEHVIQKVIQFLVSIVQRSNQNIGVQRKIPRMLHDSPGNNAKHSQVTRSIDVLQKPDCILTVSQDKIVNPLGPVIHEVTDFDHDEVQSSGPSPSIKSPESKSELENATESECPLDSSLNSPMNTSAMEPLSILEPLQPQTPALSDDSESVLGIPLEYITATEHSDGNYVTISIPESKIADNVISIPEDSVSDDSEAIKASEPGTSFTLKPQNVLVYSTLPETEYEDLFQSESLQTPQIPTIHIEDTPESALPKKSTEKIVKQTEKNLCSQQNTANNEHNYQLAVSEHNYQLDTSNAVKSSALTKNSLSNHVINVEEGLNSLKDLMASTPWNFDHDNLLALFSTDDIANNECLAGQIAVS